MSVLKDRIRELVADPRYISGIHNYCDRWCERCPFTARCMNFALSEEHLDDPQARDINNEKFWEQLSDTLKATLELLQETAADHDVDLEAADDLFDREDDERKDQQARNHECARQAEAYHQLAEQWLAGAAAVFKRKGVELTKMAEMQLPGDQPQAEAAEIKDAIGVIRWYQHFIWVKLMRALRGTIEEQDEPADFPKDSDGSAKIALIAMDRSLGAWGQLFRHLPDSEDEILDILLPLDRLRRAVEAVFPNARAFIRPGFDEQPA